MASLSKLNDARSWTALKMGDVVVAGSVNLGALSLGFDVPRPVGGTVRLSIAAALTRLDANASRIELGVGTRFEGPRRLNTGSRGVPQPEGEVSAPARTFAEILRESVAPSKKRNRTPITCSPTMLSVATFWSFSREFSLAGRAKPAISRDLLTRVRPQP